MRRTAALAAWLVLVLACSTGVWAVIRTAGEDVTTAPAVPETSDDVGPLLPAPTTPATSPGAPRTRHRSGSSGPTRPSATVPPPVSTRTAPTTTPSSDGSRRPSPSAPAQPVEVRRTWQGAAGSVVAGCRGSVIVFRGAQANAGWRVEVGDRGPAEVKVHFEQGEDGGEVEVEARCSRGTPQFSVHSG
jgi:hypothetical protein